MSDKVDRCAAVPPGNDPLAPTLLPLLDQSTRQKGFWAMNGGYELNLTFLAVAVAVAATGPWRFSIDRAIGWDDNISGLWWGLGVLGAAVVLSVLTLTLGRTKAPYPPAAAAG